MQTKQQLKILTVFLVFFLIISCKSEENKGSTIPYKVDQSYSFEVIVIESNSNVLVADTLTLTIMKKGILGSVLGMNMAEWKSKKYPNIKETRGINLETNLAEIQMPLNYPYLEYENIIIAGYPSYSKSMLVGSTSESIHLFPKSYGKLADKEIIQQKIVIDSVKIDFQGENINTQVTEYKNSSYIDELGIYELRTFYNNEFGFVKMEYTYPNQRQIEFVLIEVKKQL